MTPDREIDTNQTLIDVLLSQNEKYRGLLLIRMPLKDGREAFFLNSRPSVPAVRAANTPLDANINVKIYGIHPDRGLVVLSGNKVRDLDQRSDNLPNEGQVELKTHLFLESMIEKGALLNNLVPEFKAEWLEAYETAKEKAKSIIATHEEMSRTVENFAIDVLISDID